MKISARLAGVLAKGQPIGGFKIEQMGDWYVEGEHQFREIVLCYQGKEYFVLENYRHSDGDGEFHWPEPVELRPVRKVERLTTIYVDIEDLH